MSDRRAALELRFPELPRVCGRAVPGVVDSAEWRDWSAGDTTPDQLRIENYLDRHDLGGKAILHIGIGNSNLARRFHRRAERIVGTTIVSGELAHARASAIPNYRALMHNKYAGDPLGGGFDFIVDNNPTTFCCCLAHLEVMLSFYAAELAAGGQIVTDRVGLGWAIDVPESHPRWGFSFADLAAAAAPVGLLAYARGRQTIVLARRPPAKPGLAGQAFYFARKAARAGRRLVSGRAPA